jgi:hypothetical protein
MWIKQESTTADWSERCGEVVDNSFTYPQLLHNPYFIHINPQITHKLSTWLSTSYPHKGFVKYLSII